MKELTVKGLIDRHLYGDNLCFYTHDTYKAYLVGDNLYLDETRLMEKRVSMYNTLEKVVLTADEYHQLIALPFTDVKLKINGQFEYAGLEEYDSITEGDFLNVGRVFKPNKYYHIPIHINEDGTLSVLLVSKTSGSFALKQYSPALFKANVKYRGLTVSGQSLKEKLEGVHEIHTNPPDYMQDYEVLSAALGLFGDKDNNNFECAYLEYDNYGGLILLDNGDIEQSIWDFKDIRTIREVCFFDFSSVREGLLVNSNKLDDYSKKMAFYYASLQNTLISLIGYKKLFDTTKYNKLFSKHVYEISGFLILKSDFENTKLGKDAIDWLVRGEVWELLIISDCYKDSNPVSIAYASDVIYIGQDLIKSEEDTTFTVHIGQYETPYAKDGHDTAEYSTTETTKESHCKFVRTCYDIYKETKL